MLKNSIYILARRHARFNIPGSTNNMFLLRQLYTFISRLPKKQFNRTLTYFHIIKRKTSIIIKIKLSPLPHPLNVLKNSQRHT